MSLVLLGNRQPRKGRVGQIEEKRNKNTEQENTYEHIYICICRSTVKQNRLNGFAAAYIHKDLDINPDEILKFYTQTNYRRFDFGVSI